MRNKINLAGILCVTNLALCLPISAQTMPRKPSSPAVSPSAPAASAAAPAKQGMRPTPFHGMIAAVDQNAKTFTIAGKAKSRVFKVTNKTAITKSGTAASMQDITENEEASGSYRKTADGTLEAKTVKIGPKTKSSPSPAASPSPKP